MFHRLSVCLNLVLVPAAGIAPKLRRYQQMLTDSQVRSVKPSDRPRSSRIHGGLYLQVMPKGGRYWRFNYRFEGKQKTLALGTYPGRVACEGAFASARGPGAAGDGIDPAAGQAGHQQAVRERGPRVVRPLESGSQRAPHGLCPPSPVRWTFSPKSYPAGARASRHPISGTWRRGFERRGAMDIARRVLQTCGQVMRYAVVNDLVAHNPRGGGKAGRHSETP